MKFTKEKAVEEITAKITDKDKDLDLARTVNECVENALKMVGDNEEMELSEFVSFVQPFVATAAGLAHKNAATATKTLQEKIAELEKKDPAKTDPKTDPKKDPEPNNEMKALLDRIEALEKDKAANEKAIKIADKRKAIASKLKELGVTDEKWVDNMLKEVSITEETDVEQKSKDYLAIYNSSHTTTSITPKAPGASTGKIDLSQLDQSLREMRGDFGKTNDNTNN